MARLTASCDIFVNRWGACAAFKSGLVLSLGWRGVLLGWDRHEAGFVLHWNMTLYTWKPNGCTIVQSKRKAWQVFNGRTGK